MSQPPIRVCVVMAGGSGERFWPLSRRQRPKQLLNLTDPSRSLLEETVARVAPIIPPDRVLIATTRDLQAPIRAAGVGVPDENVLAEPRKRNTAGCLTYVAAHILARWGQEADRVSLAVFSADHLIPDATRFLKAVEAALEVVEREPLLAIMGVRPTRPETGYGYIEIARDAPPLEGTPPEVRVYPVARFREKPNAETAADFIATGRFFWNSGMFFWSLATFMDELSRASPAHADAARAMADALTQRDEAEVERLFEPLEDISIDYALMERARRVVAIRADFEWDDIGAWDSLDRIRPHDPNGNVAVGDPILVETRDCVVYNEPGAGEMAVAVVGVENLAIIVSDDAVLVIPKSRAQDVRKAVAILKERQAPQL